MTINPSLPPVNLRATTPAPSQPVESSPIDMVVPPEENLFTDMMTAVARLVGHRNPRLISDGPYPNEAVRGLG